MSFRHSPPAAAIAARARAILAERPELARDSVVERILAEQGKDWDEWGRRSSAWYRP